MDTPKEMHASNFSSIRRLVDTVNTQGIQREDIVSIVNREDGIFLIYYK